MRGRILRSGLAGFGLSLGLSGCGALPDAQALFVADVATDRALGLEIRAALHDEDKLLLFLSRGKSGGMPYGCGDPKSKKRADLKREDAEKSKAVQAAVELISNYATALDDLKDRKTQADAALSQVKSSLNLLGTLSGHPEIATATSLGTQGASLLANAATTLEARSLLAQYASKGLNEAIVLLQSNTTVLRGDELKAFREWDQCARETLAYIRDVPLGLVRIKQTGQVYKAYVAQSTGVEMKNAYMDYLKQRADFIKQVPHFGEHLAQLQKQNEALASGRMTPEDANALIGSLAQIGQEAGSMNKAVGDQS